VLRLQLLLGQLGTRFTPATFPWAHLGRGMMRASVDSARLLERAREATASPGLLAAEDELRLLVRALAGLREFLNERSQRITRTTKVLVDAAKRASSSSGGGVEGQGPEYPASAYGRTQTGDYPAAMFTICQAWLLLQLRSRGLANSDLGSRWVGGGGGRLGRWGNAGLVLVGERWGQLPRTCTVDGLCQSVFKKGG
jgi:hypothetical protein